MANVKGVTAKCEQKGSYLTSHYGQPWEPEKQRQKTAQLNLADPDNEKEEPPLPEVKNEYQVINQTLSDINTQDLNPEVKEKSEKKEFEETSEQRT